MPASVMISKPPPMAARTAARDATPALTWGRPFRILAPLNPLAWAIASGPQLYARLREQERADLRSCIPLGPPGKDVNHGCQ